MLWRVKGHPSLNTTPTVCAKCHGAGWVRVAVGPEMHWQMKTERCSCLAELMAHERWERALAASDITPHLLTLSFGGYDTQPHHSTASLAPAGA
jgi:hypothetical protein